MVDGQICPGGSQAFPQPVGFLDGKGRPRPMMLALPGCLSDLSDLDKVQVGLMAVISILSLTKAQVVSCTA